MSDNNWSFRLAEPKDAPAFAEWVARNPQIDPHDVKATLTENNPTTLFFVATKDGVPVAFAPIYVAAVLAHLGFSPDAEGRDKLHAMQTLIDGCTAFFTQYGIREILTMTKSEYPVGAWALKHGFTEDSRQTFKLDINRLIAAKG